MKGRLVSPIRAGGGCERFGELYEIPYKRVEQKKEERIKDWKKGGKLGQVVGALKTEGLEPPFELLKYINVWVSMMSGHSTTSIFLVKK